MRSPTRDKTALLNPSIGSPHCPRWWLSGEREGPLTPSDVQSRAGHPANWVPCSCSFSSYAPGHRPLPVLSQGSWRLPSLSFPLDPDCGRAGRPVSPAPSPRAGPIRERDGRRGHGGQGRPGAGKKWSPAQGAGPGSAQLPSEAGRAKRFLSSGATSCVTSVTLLILFVPRYPHLSGRGRKVTCVGGWVRRI